MARRNHVFDALGLPRLYVARSKFNPIEPPSTDPALAARRLGPAPCKSGKSPAAGEKAAGLPESPHARLGTRRMRWSTLRTDWLLAYSHPARWSCGLRPADLWTPIVLPRPAVAGSRQG